VWLRTTVAVAAGRGVSLGTGRVFVAAGMEVEVAAVMALAVFVGITAGVAVKLHARVTRTKKIMNRTNLRDIV
jgi:hypothetical protein